MRAKSLAQACEVILQELRKNSIITNEAIADYEKSIDKNLHSILQWILMSAGEKCGFIPLPEFKVKLKRPIDPKDYGLQRKRKIHKIRVDVAFLDRSSSKPIGIGEVFTLDMAHACYDPRCIKELNWITARIKIPHVLKYGTLADEPFIVAVVTLPRVAKKRPSWKDQKMLLAGSKDYYEKFAREWVKLIDEVREDGYSANLVILTERKIEIY